MRNFHHTENGKEVTTEISDEMRFFTSYNHFISQTVSNEKLQCVTDCELLRITRKNVEKAAAIGLISQEYTEKALQYYLHVSKQRMVDLTTLSEKECYLKLMKFSPAIIHDIPLVYTASYLGLNAGSVSRIRQEVS